VVYSASTATTRAKIVDIMVIEPKGTARGAAAPRDVVGVAVVLVLVLVEDVEDVVRYVEYEEALEVVDDMFVVFALSYIKMLDQFF